MGAAVFDVTRRSAATATGVDITLTLLQLFAALGSLGPAPARPTHAVLVRVPVPVATTGTVIVGKLVFGFCGAASTRVQVIATGPAAGNGGVAGTVVHVQPVPVTAARRLMPAGTSSVTVTVCPAATATGPVLRTVSVYVKLKPGTTGVCDTVFAIDRSALLLPVTLAVAVLLDSTGSVSGAAIVAVLGSVAGRRSPSRRSRSSACW